MNLEQLQFTGGSGCHRRADLDSAKGTTSWRQLDFSPPTCFVLPLHEPNRHFPVLLSPSPPEDVFMYVRSGGGSGEAGRPKDSVTGWPISESLWRFGSSERP